MGRFFKFGCLGIVGLVILAAVAGALMKKPEPTPQAAAPTSAPAATEAHGAAPAAATAPSKPTDKPSPTDVPKPAAMGKVGEPFELGGISILVSKVSKAASNGLGTAKPGQTYLIADVTIESPGRDESPYNPLYFKVRDSDGFEATGGLISPDPSLKSGKLAKGEKARGNVSFDVKTESKGFVLTYEPLVIFGGYKQIRIDLGQ